MNIEELNEYILHYIKSDKTQSAIMLDGAWGSGKTYYIEHNLIKYLTEQKICVVVVSLYGVQDVSTISRSIYMELRLKTLERKHSETLTTGKVIAKSVIKNIPGVFGLDLKICDEDLEKIYKSVNLDNKLIIFEDVERSSTSINNIMGYINGLVERDGAKVLLVTNEKELFEQEKDGNISPEKQQYNKLKEKTVSDTIDFTADYQTAIGQIIEDFNSIKLNSIIRKNKALYSKMVSYVQMDCKGNLRTFIFALQKTINILDIIDTAEYDNDFLECLILGIISFVAKTKNDGFRAWGGDNYLSTKLGDKSFPLMRFAYDYIRWQTFDLKSVKKTKKAFDEFRFFDEYAEHRDDDIKVLANYCNQTEEEVLIALNNIERKLEKVYEIGINAYGKLAYFIIYVGDLVGFDYKKSCKQMIKNAKKINNNSKIYIDDYYSESFELEDKALRQIYCKFLDDLSNAIIYKEEQEFSYNPKELKDFHNYLVNNKHEYLKAHRFLSIFNQNKIVEMLTKSTSAEIHEFRSMLFIMYRNARKSHYDERDVKSMEELLKLLNEQTEKNNNWDKIQQQQIKWLKKNLDTFITQMQ